MKGSVSATVFGAVVGLSMLAIGTTAWMLAHQRDTTTPPMETDALVKAIEKCGRLQATAEIHTDYRDRPQWVTCYWTSENGGKESSEP